MRCVLLLHGEFKQTFDEVGEGHALYGGLSGNKACSGHARSGVDFENEERAIVAQDEVGAAVAFQTEGFVRPQCGVLHQRCFFGSDGCGANFLCPIGGVFIMVIEIVAFGDNKDGCKCLVTEDAGGRLVKK